MIGHSRILMSGVNILIKKKGVGSTQSGDTRGQTTIGGARGC